MKKLLTIILPAAVLAAVTGFALTSQANASDIGPVAHTESRFCGDHCHHHGHYWSCGGCSYWCCGH